MSREHSFHGPEAQDVVVLSVRVPDILEDISDERPAKSCARAAKGGGQGAPGTARQGGGGREEGRAREWRQTHMSARTRHCDLGHVHRQSRTRKCVGGGGEGGADPSLPPEDPVVVVKMSFHTPSTMGDVAMFCVGDTSASLMVFTCAARAAGGSGTGRGGQQERCGKAPPRVCRETFCTKSSGEPTPFFGPDLQTSMNSARETAAALTGRRSVPAAQARVGSSSRRGEWRKRRTARTGANQTCLTSGLRAAALGCSRQHRPSSVTTAHVLSRGRRVCPSLQTDTGGPRTWHGQAVGRHGRTSSTAGPARCAGTRAPCGPVQRRRRA